MSGRKALVFLEAELRLMVPGPVRRAWPDDSIEDALRGFLLKVIEVPLPPNVEDPRAYIARAFRNHCIDIHEARRRRREVSVEESPVGWQPLTAESASPEAKALQREQVRRLNAALSKLDIDDRIALKLEAGPEWLDDDEVRWLAERSGLTYPNVRSALASAADMHDLSRVFDPGDDDPTDTELRRKRMERFRRRRTRARDKLRTFLGEAGS